MASVNRSERRLHGSTSESGEITGVDELHMVRTIAGSQHLPTLQSALHPIRVAATRIMGSYHYLRA
jgi:hypothetical protein